MYSHFLRLLIGLVSTLLLRTDPVFFRSNALQNLSLTPLPGEYFIRDDENEQVPVVALKDAQGILYWYRRVDTEVCLTGECKRVDVGLYWYCTGDFLGLEVYREHLTKTDHSNFGPQDYDKLIAVLSNDWSSLREYALADLTDEKPAGVDGVSGATKKEIAAEAVVDAVYTTHTLWHLVHVGEKEQLVPLTIKYLNESDLVDKLIQSNQKKYRSFLLDASRQSTLQPTRPLQALILEGLTIRDDPSYRHAALKALAATDLSDAWLQAQLAPIYQAAVINEKIEILPALKTIQRFEPALYSALAHDLDPQQEWLAVKILQVLQAAPTQSDQVLQTARQLQKSQSTFVRKAADDFFSEQK
ncbi:hypothetical protein GCM10027275_47310 [Rhabdobacter roseus]|uniref:Uncharacterized protein n=1 Tax=Rhabdobacter roseus TaxID=1655419 RepID=A0A840U3H2_9BACT|nr:hypothetical protein [Rhabdobacter roseus]MBB5286389.1 hypothetical protein [Rhabdobacter roseus]